VTALAARWWPRSLAVRLTLLVVLALAVAQGGLTLLLSTERDSLFEGLVHSQSLSQAVTLARLLETYPTGEAGTLTAAFSSRQSCAWVRTTPPAPRAMSREQQQLASVLARMMHGVPVGMPVVTVEGPGGQRRHCNDAASAVLNDTLMAPDESERDDDGDVSAALTMDIPLTDGRWVSVRTGIELPGSLDNATLITFLLSSAAVAAVAVIAVRGQTRSLRALADASERFGRGETVPILPTGGPAEVSTATHAFNVMQARLSQSMLDRLRLFASVSHDLRTPITTLRLKAEFIEDETVKEDLIRTIDELAVICEATLTFSQAETASEPKLVLSARDLVEEVAREYRLAGKRIALGQLDPVRCVVRPVALKRALRNLIDNAIRYGEVARLSVALAGGDAVLAVEDDGPGIPAESMAAAFEPFVRLEPSRSTETGGIGLGLSIARGIVIGLGGTLVLTNLPVRGLRAEIRLPAIP
jgi:signal transduction histidine kinase